MQGLCRRLALVMTPPDLPHVLVEILQLPLKLHQECFIHKCSSFYNSKRHGRVYLLQVKTRIGLPALH